MALTDLLESCWQLKEASGNALDSQGSNTLADNNTVGAAAGKIIGSRLFNGTNEYFSCDSNSSLRTGDISFTFSYWAYLNNISASYAFAKGFEEEYFSTFSNPFTGVANRFSFGVRRGASYLVANADNFGDISTGTWYWVRCWHDAAANTANISINNGTANSVATGGALNAAGDGVFLVGTGNLYLEYNFPGRLEQLAFWKRVLTNDEATAIYNGGAGLAFSSWAGGGSPGSPLLQLMQQYSLTGGCL